MNKSGLNQFKRAFRDARESNLIDAKNPTGLTIADEPQQTTIITDNGQQFIQILPNRRQEFSDKVQLKTFPGYRLLDGGSCSTTTTIAPTTTPDDGLVSSDLNPDVTEFLKLLNDVGSRISYFIDPANANDFASTREIVTDKLNMDSISSNIIRGVESLKAFFFEFGKKIAPPGVNPYFNDDCSQVGGKSHNNHSHHNNHNHGHNQLNVSFDAKGKDIEYAKAPYNPHDLNTYMNCLETLTRQSTVRETSATYEDFNLKVFQSIITKVKTTKFVDDGIDELGVTRPLPFYNPLHLMVEFLKIDTKLFNILYLLNLHNSCKSPITGVYYGKLRTKINENGFPVLSDTVTSSDINNATTQTLDLIGCILHLITFIDLDAYNKLIEDHFSISAVGIVPDASGEPIIIDDTASYNNYTGTGSQENIPTFLYGQLLSFCDAARQAVNEIILGTFPNSPLYNPTKVANIAYNCTFGLLAVAQLIEGLLKSRCFAMVMSMLFPSGTFHSAPQMEDRSLDPDFGPRFQFPRQNDEDMQSITRLAIDGIPIDMTKVVPPKSIPNYIPKDDPISINKAIFCSIITALCGISRFLWNSNSPCLRLCDLTDEGAFDPDVPYPAPDETTTTCPPTTCDLNDLIRRRGYVDDFDNDSIDDLDRVNVINTGSRGYNRGNCNSDSNSDCHSDCHSDYHGGCPNTTVCTNNRGIKLDKSVSSANRAVRSSNNSVLNAVSRATPRILTTDIIVPPEVDNQPDPQDLFSIKGMIKYLQDNTFASVLTSNGKVFTYFQVYISAFASHDRQTFNDRVAKSRARTIPSAVNRDLYSKLTRGIQF